MTRTIPLKIQNEYIAGDKVLIGAAGSHNDVVLRMEFSPMWEGLTKTVQFRDALGEKTIETLLTADLLEKNSTTVYMVPVPNGAKKYAGEMTLAVKGAAVSGDKETRATTAVHGAFTVGESKWDTSAETEQDVPPTQAEQLQRQIDAVLGTINGAAASANAAAASAQSAAESAETATAAAESIGNSVTAAAKSAEGAALSQSRAQTSEQYAGEYAQGAANSAASASSSATAAASSATAAKASEDAAQSWAVGGTGTREGEDTNNAKYWAEQAQRSIIKGSVTLTVAGWVADGDDWKQTVTIAGGAAGKQVDLEADKMAIKQMLEDGTSALYIANNNGTFTAHAVGEKPTAALTLQTTMYDVKGAV